MTGRLPQWFKVPMPGGPNYLNLTQSIRKNTLHTVCEEAHCPNIGDCWERGTATFMILGDICTRACRYCAVTSGTPMTLDLSEPDRLAEAVQSLNLAYCVITSVNRDDLPDGGAHIFSRCIDAIRQRMPYCKVEILIPDFDGNWEALETVMNARPDVLNHNIETVRRTFHPVRPRGNYDQSLEILRMAGTLKPHIPTKSGIMVGLGEEWSEIVQTMVDLRSVGCQLLTIGQYLQPSKKHVPIDRFYRPEEFEKLQEIGEHLGFLHVAAGPLVRSSYHADEQHAAATAGSDPPR